MGTALFSGFGQTQYHQLGHIRLWVTLLDQEWQIRSEALELDTDPASWTETIGYPASACTAAAIHSGKPIVHVTFLPALAKLPTVIRPFQPLTIPPGGRCTIYVGTLVWMKVCVGDKQTVLTEIPLATPSLTWVGRNTMAGELCYASPSFARLVLEAVPKRPWRAVTPVTLINRREEPLLLERFSLPTPLLSLHQNDRGQLWTPGVTVEVETDMNSASLHVEQSLFAAAGACRHVADAGRRWPGDVGARF